MARVLVHKTPGVIDDSISLGRLTPDPLLETANNGIPWLVDMGFSASYVGTSPVPNGAVVNNVVGGGAASSVAVPGTLPTIAGAGLSYAAADTAGTHVTIPASVAGAINTASQRFMFSMYVKLPTSSNWSANNAQGNPILNWCASSTWLSEADILHIGLQNASGNPILSVRRQTAVGTSESLTNFQLLGSPHLGQVCQISYWRDASFQNSSIRSAAGGRQSNLGIAAGVNNSASIASLVGKIGILPVWGTLDSQEILAKSNLRFYRAFVEIPATSLRDPLNVLDADYVRNIGRFS